MNKRRKGEHLVDQWMFYEPYDDRHPVARAIRTGTQWFTAWQFQYCQPTPKLAYRTGIKADRIYELSCGATITRKEVEALAKVYCVYPSDLLASMPDSQEVIEG